MRVLFPAPVAKPRRLRAEPLRENEGGNLKQVFAERILLVACRSNASRASSCVIPSPSSTMRIRRLPPPSTVISTRFAPASREFPKAPSPQTQAAPPPHQRRFLLATASGKMRMMLNEIPSLSALAAATALKDYQFKQRRVESILLDRQAQVVQLFGVNAAGASHIMSMALAVLGKAMTSRCSLRPPSMPQFGQGRGQFRRAEVCRIPALQGRSRSVSRACFVAQAQHLEHLSCTSWRWIRIEPPPISEPFKTRS